MKKFFGAIILSMMCLTSYANTGGPVLDKAPDLSNDLPALQSGAKLFVNYCLNCHGAKALRYNRLLEIGLTEQQVTDNLLFTGDKIGDLMTVAMRPGDAKVWFGAAPPDLSIIARARGGAGGTGSDYLYTYLRSFYRDEARPTGWNNLIFPNVGMPHVLWELQGERQLKTVEVAEVTDPKTKVKGWAEVTTVYEADGFTTQTSKPLANHSGGPSMHTTFTPVDAKQSAAFDKQAAEITAFMTFIAEPDVAKRQRLGFAVLAFLAFFAFVAWRLNKAFWKDVK